MISFTFFIIVSCYALYINYSWYKHCNKINEKWAEHCNEINEKLADIYNRIRKENKNE